MKYCHMAKNAVLVYNTGVKSRATYNYFLGHRIRDEYTVMHKTLPKAPTPPIASLLAMKTSNSCQLSWTVMYGILFAHTGTYSISREVDTSKHRLFMQHLSVISVEFNSKG